MLFRSKNLVFVLFVRTGDKQQHLIPSWWCVVSSSYHCHYAQSTSSLATMSWTAAVGHSSTAVAPDAVVQCASAIQSNSCSSLVRCLLNNCCHRSDSWPDSRWRWSCTAVVALVVRQSVWNSSWHWPCRRPCHSTSITVPPDGGCCWSVRYYRCCGVDHDP